MKLKTLTSATAGLLAAGMVLAQPYGMGPGVGPMGGGGYGMGPGMMGDNGIGQGMMWGYSGEAYAGLNLSGEQRRQIAAVQESTSKAMWQLMGTMHEQGYRMDGMFGPGSVDEAAARRAYESMAATRQAMFELQLEARRKVDAVLTAEQRDKLRRYWGSR